MSMQEFALQRAVETRRESDEPADVVKAAQAYLDFLYGKTPGQPKAKPKAKKR